MASPEPAAAQPSTAQETPTPPAAEQEGAAPLEPAPEEAAADAAPAAEAEKVGGDGEEEGEEGECGFCLYMKGGGCRNTFVAWEECVEAAQKEGTDMVERCYEATINLKKCMEAHADYYGPVLMVEQDVNDRAEAEAAAAAAAADAAKDKGGDPATDVEKKEEGVHLPAASSSPPYGEEKKEEAVADKV